MSMDYCDTPEEVAANPSMKAWIKAIANGDESAYFFMWRFWCFEHMFDDLVDQDKGPVPTEVAARELMLFVAALSFNSFYQTHKQSLFPLIVQALNRWVDGDEWRQSSDPEKSAVSHVVRCGELEIFMHCAFLLGGWEFMRHLKDFRSYDTNDTQKEAV